MHSRRKSVLFINGLAELDQVKEFSEVQDILHGSSYSVLSPLFDACYSRIKKNIGTSRNLSILYFSGHGETDGVMIRNRRPEVKEGAPSKLTADSIHQAIAFRGRAGIDLTIFNCCKSAQIARRIALMGLVKITIGWESEVSGAKCSSFVQSFFRGLVKKSATGDLAIKNAYDQAIAELEKPHPCIYYRTERSFDIAIELCKKTLQDRNSRIATTLRVFLGLKAEASLDEIAKKLLVPKAGRMSAIGKYASYLESLTRSESERFSGTFFDEIRIINDLAYTQSLPDTDLAVVISSLHEGLSMGEVTSERRIVLPSKMTLEQIQLILRKARAELKDRDAALKEYEWYYNHTDEGGDISYLYEDKLVLLDCSVVQKEIDGKRCESVARNAALRYPETSLIAATCMGFKEIVEFFVQKNNTIAILTPSDQMEAWADFLKLYPMIYHVVRPALDIDRYRELDIQSRRAGNLIRKLMER